MSQADTAVSGGFKVERNGGVVTLIFDRPMAGNAITPEMVPLLTDVFRQAQADTDVRCVLIRGEGRHFSAGGDVAGFASLLDGGTDALTHAFDEKLRATGAMVQAVLAFDRPILAAVRGAVAGAGLMFALAADLVFADPTAAFLFSHQRIGLCPDGGVSWLLPRAVGERTARRLMLTAARVEAQEAYRIGLVTDPTSEEALLDEAQKAAARLARAPQTAVRLAKGLLGEASFASIGDQLDAERHAIVSCVGAPDFAEGVRAFMEKRSPVFPSTVSG